MLADLPNDVAALVCIVQGLGVYDVVAPDFYGFNVPDEPKNEIHIRPIKEMLDRLLAISNQPLTVARPIEKRLVSRCRNFLLFLLSILRARASRLGPVAVSVPTSIPATSRITGSVNIGTPLKSVGFSLTSNLTRSGEKS